MRNMQNKITEGTAAGGHGTGRRDALRRVRAQAMLVRRLNAQLRELSPDGLHSMRLNGMPAGKGGVPGGLNIFMEKKEALSRLLTRETRIMHAYEKEARREMEQMKPEHYAFSALYYIGAMTIEETADAMDRSARQCGRYKREIEED